MSRVVHCPQELVAVGGPAARTPSAPGRAPKSPAWTCCPHQLMQYLPDGLHSNDHAALRCGVSMLAYTCSTAAGVLLHEGSPHCWQVQHISCMDLHPQRCRQAAVKVQRVLSMCCLPVLRLWVYWTPQHTAAWLLQHCLQLPIILQQWS